MWRVIKRMYQVTKSSVLLDGEISNQFDISQRVGQGCSLSPILFTVFINDLLNEVEKSGSGISISEDCKVGGLMFADDFVGLAGDKDDLQKLIDVVYAFCKKWRLRANINKSAVMVFSKNIASTSGRWSWGDNEIAKVDSYCYLGVDFAFNGSWDIYTH